MICQKISFLFIFFHFASLVATSLGIYRPELYDDFVSKRDSCNWNPIAFKDFPGAPRVFNDMYECIVEGIEYEEGSGFFRILRFGPFITKGGDMITGKFYKPKMTSSRGAWRKGFIGQIIDPHTENAMEYPPLHFHHLVTRLRPDPTMFSMRDEFPFITNGHGAGSFPRVAADFSCSAEDGGTTCSLWCQSPPYADWVDERDNDANILLMLDDVRVEGSLSLTSYVEYAEMFLTDVHPSAPAIMRTRDAQFFLRGVDTYPVRADVSVYNFDTFYISTDTELEDVIAHAHWSNGDEVWVVKGTQEDLGILPAHRRPVISTHEQALSNAESPVPEVPDNDLPTLLKTLKANVQAAAIQFERHKHESRLRGSFDKSAHEHGRAGVFKVYDPTHDTPPSRPEILCKFHGHAEEYSAIKVTNRKEVLDARYAADVEKASSRTSKNSWHSVAAVASGSAWTPPEQQRERMYSSVKEGTYYRQPTRSSADPLEAEHSQCDSMHFKAGDHLTLLGFNVARGEPVDGRSGGALKQHTALLAQARMPKFEKFYGESRT